MRKKVISKPAGCRSAGRSSPRSKLVPAGASIVVSFLATVTLFSCSRELPPVSGITATPNGTSLSVSWKAVAGATGYELFLSSSSSVSPTQYTLNVVSASNSATVTGLTVGDTYYLIVAPTSLNGFSFGTPSEVVAVQVTGAPANPAPVITEINVSPQPATAGTSVLCAATASDTDGDTLTYTWSIDGGTVAGPTADLNQINWTSTAGSHTVTVSVTDGTTTVSASMTFSG